MNAHTNLLLQTKWKEAENTIKPAKLWELVKSFEEGMSKVTQDNNELVATLIVNYSELNKGRHPVLINSKDRPLSMLIKVLEYYHNEVERLKSELAKHV